MNQTPYEHLRPTQAWDRPLALSAMDTMFWRTDPQPGMRFNLLAVELLDHAPDWHRLVARHEQLSHTVARLRLRINEPPLRLGRYRLGVDSSFDIHRHLRRIQLPAPGTVRQLLDFAQSWVTSPFDPHRPLWEAMVVEGLHDNQAAYLFKVHHSIVDGLGAAQIMFTLHDTTAEPGPITPPPPATAPDHGPPFARLYGWLRQRRNRIPRSETTAPPRHRAPSWRAIATGLRAVARATVLPAATSSSLLAHRDGYPRMELFEIPLNRLKKAGRAADGSLNDIYLAILAGAFDRYHQTHGQSLRSVPAMVPISTRRPDSAPGGNHVTIAKLALPAAGHGPAERVAIIRRTVTDLRAGPTTRAEDLLARVLTLLPVSVTRCAATLIFRGNDLTASNFPGSPTEVYLAGTKVIAFHPFLPLLRSAVTTVMTSYQDKLQVGINLDTAAIPQPEVFMKCLRDSLSEALDLRPTHLTPTTQSPDDTAHE
ncbi:wax ester/triacylglycerol synthase domain-containing protein [Amycolatopsis sp. NPDC051071]|uniref:wax ester/triacylglycerol synthase domain-containing protein n=1 Tax=Amycolatopsis sp. NPDC051071 TaxID=3154637 RepID=UPI00343FE639